MLDGMYSAAAGMEAQQEQIDALANDVANMSTPGYQATRVDFHDLLYTSAGAAATGTTVATGAGAAAEIVGRSQVEGRPSADRTHARCRDHRRGIPRGPPSGRHDRPDPQRRAPGRRPGSTDDGHGDAASAADADPEGHLDRLDQDRAERGRALGNPGPRPHRARHRARRPIGCSPTVTACSARRRRAAASAARLARRCSRGRLRARTSTSRPR